MGQARLRRAALRAGAGRSAGRPSLGGPALSGPALPGGDAADGRGVKRPGLLVEWRDLDGRWQGRVVYVGLLRSGAWALVEEWLPAESAHAVLTVLERAQKLAEPLASRVTSGSTRRTLLIARAARKYLSCVRANTTRTDDFN